jgi:hypothetical protein
MERNYKRMLNQLMMGYLKSRLEREPEGERCGICLELCCNHDVDVQNDPFLSLTTVSEFQHA